MARAEQVLDLETLKKLSITRLESIDLEKAKADVRPFLMDSRVLDVWSLDLFKAGIEKL